MRFYATDRSGQRARRLALRSAVKLTLALAVSTVLAIAMPAPVAAHTGLESSQPSDGQVVDEPVAQISLTFNRPVEPAGDGFTVSEGQGPRYLPDSLSSADGQVWRLHFDTPLGNGVYEVWWRVAAEDGHIVEGTFGFAVDVPQAAPPTEAPPDSTGESTAESSDGTVAAADDAEDSPAETLGAGTVQTGLSAPVTTLRAGDGTPSAATTTPSELAASGTTASADSGADSEGDPPRRARSSSGATGAERIADTLRILSLLATLAVVGGLAFVSFIVRDEPSERTRVHRVLFVGAIALIAATVIAAPTQAVVIEDAWRAVVSVDAISDALAAPFGIAVGLRVLGGIVVLALARPDTASASRIRRCALGLIGAALVIVSYSFDGHTVTEGPRLLHAAANAMHVSAAAVWSGGLVLLADLLRRRRGGTDMAGPLNRFSQLAAAALVLAGVAGTVMAVLVMDRFADLWSTGWGRLLIAKVALVAVAVVLGARNRWVHMPALAHAEEHAQRHAHQRLRRAVSIEAAILVCVGVVTAFLVGASAL
ncbi:copper resistance CopC/CopD family protein [Candidatus Poriferisodalis sp.]|uniref:copper resistance CopC/CopD family protein n=1 Tax=Candidatus Poriferisodalis sp. TaxID=3101277 RepID=UPI003B01E992